MTRKKAAKKSVQTGTEDDSIAAKLLSPIGRKVKFTYPGDEPSKTGLLKDRAFIPSPGATGVPY
jgi:hypothetical protein